MCDDIQDAINTLEGCSCTLLVVQQQPAFLQHQREAVISPSLGVDQRARILQGFKLQRNGRPARPPTQPVEGAAAAVKVRHIGSYRTTQSFTLQSPSTGCRLI